MLLTILMAACCGAALAQAPQYNVSNLDALGGTNSRGDSINNRGWVAGFSNLPGDQSRHATLWLMIANRYFVQVELQNEDPGELREWIKHIDLKKLAEIK